MIIRRFVVGEGGTREEVVEEATQALDMIASSFESAGQLAIAASSRAPTFRTI